MNRLVIRKPSWLQVVNLAQILLLLFYLSLNITNIGESSGTGLPLLVLFFILSVTVLFIQSINKNIVIRLHLFFFFLFVFWIALRVVIDLSDIQYLKQITIATTGGILLFFFIGTFSRQAIEIISKTKSSVFSLKIVLLTFFAISLSVFFSLKSRLLERVDMFYIEGVDGGYQRPGNFLIIIFIIVSFSCLSIASNPSTKAKTNLFFWLVIYSIGFIAALVSSQMFGSNTATANIMAIYLITIVLSMIGFNKKYRSAFLNAEATYFFSKRLIVNLLKYSFLSILATVIIALVIIQITNFDLDKTRIFGFGSGDNTSISSRANIFKLTGLEQLSYAPILGNMNVAKLITKEEGSFLHYFALNIMAELGLLGLLIAIIIFTLVFYVLIKNIKNVSKDAIGFRDYMVYIWILFILLFLLIYANIAVEKSWVVIWFYVGFSVNAIYAKAKVKNIMSIN